MDISLFTVFIILSNCVYHLLNQNVLAGVCFPLAYGRLDGEWELLL